MASAAMAKSSGITSCAHTDTDKMSDATQRKAEPDKDKTNHEENQEEEKAKQTDKTPQARCCVPV